MSHFPCTLIHSSLKPQLEHTFLVPKISGSLLCVSQAEARNAASSQPAQGRQTGLRGTRTAPYPLRSACWAELTFCPPTLSLLRWVLLQKEHTSSKLVKAACLQQSWHGSRACKSTVGVRCWFIARFLNESPCLKAPGAPPCLDLGSFWVGSLCCQIFAAEVRNQESETVKWTLADKAFLSNPAQLQIYFYYFRIYILDNFSSGRGVVTAWSWAL